MQLIQFVLGIHFLENISLRNKQFYCPQPLYLLWVFTSHHAWGQEVESRWLFRWAQRPRPPWQSKPWQARPGTMPVGTTITNPAGDPHHAACSLPLGKLTFSSCWDIREQQGCKLCKALLCGKEKSIFILVAQNGRS